MRILLILLVLPVQQALAAEVAFIPSVTDPESVGVRLGPTKNEEVVAIQFDVHHPALTMEVSPGSGAVAVRKTVLSSRVDDFRTRVLVFGMNRSGLPEGLLVLLKARGTSTPPDSGHSISLSETVASDSEGRSLQVSAAGPVTIRLPAAVSPRQVAPLVVVQDGWTTSFRFANLSNQPNLLRMEFFSASGAPQAFPSDGIEPAAEYSFSLQPGGAALLDSSASQPGSGFAGWVRVSADGSYAGTAILRRNAGTVVCEAAVPLMAESLSATKGIQWDHSSGGASGIALANPSDTAATDISLLVYDAAGLQVASSTVQLAPRSQAVFALNETFPFLSEGTGTILFTSKAGTPFGLLALRFNPSGCFTSLPVFEK